MSVALATIGHNSPPGPLAFASDTMRDLSDWMKEHPVIEGEDDAREAKLLLDRAKNCAGEIEAERDKMVRPLNTEIADINAAYKAIHNEDRKNPGTLDKVVNELKARLTAFLQAEEDRRLAVAEAKRREAEEAERLAREAEARAREAVANAKAGELDVDVTQVVIEADSRFSAFKKADRVAQRAERDSHVKIGGGFQKSASLRTVETLILNDPITAILEMGMNDNIRDAILSAARDYRKSTGSLPSGVTASTERKL